MPSLPDDPATFLAAFLLYDAAETVFIKKHDSVFYSFAILSRQAPSGQAF
jgi:hypothetical protein